jgi:hypothetical protein
MLERVSGTDGHFALLFLIWLLRVLMRAFPASWHSAHGGDAPCG